MAKNTAAPQPQLPFDIEGNTASRDQIRQLSTNLDHYRKVNLDIIAIRPGHNARRQNGMTEELWELRLTIPDLADKIFTSNGPANPIIGDFHEDGKFYITNGERTYRALRHLVRTGRETYANGKSVTDVTVLMNAPGTTDLQRKIKMYAANETMPFTQMEKAHFYLSLTTGPEKMTHDQIADLFHVSRQTVGNGILAATQLPQAVQDAIDTGEVKMTNALAEIRKGRAEAKGKTTASNTDDEPIITGALADKLVKEEKENEKLRGDEDEFQQQDNSITFAGTKSGPAEDKSSGAIAIGKDAIYMKGQREASIKQMLNRFDRLFENACKLILPEKPGDEEDEERAAILYDKRMKHVISQLAEEYDVTVR